METTSLSGLHLLQSHLQFLGAAPQQESCLEMDTAKSFDSGSQLLICAGFCVCLLFYPVVPMMGAVGRTEWMHMNIKLGSDFIRAVAGLKFLAK